MFGKIEIGKVSSIVVTDSDVSKSKNSSLRYSYLNKEKGLYSFIAEAPRSGLVSVDSSDLNRSNENDQ